MSFTILAILTFGLSMLATIYIKRVAFKYQVLDDPKSAPHRKIQKNPIPLLGGVAIYSAFVVTCLIAFAFGLFPQGEILSKHIIGLLMGGFWLLIAGVLDDKKGISPLVRLGFQFLAALSIVISGIGIESFTNPWGGQWFLNDYVLTIFSWHGIPYKITFLSDLFSIIWLMVVMNAIKFFDGLDGLVSGITIIGSMVVLFTSLLPVTNQPETALLALIVAACFAGFLVFNINPASIFLGEVGSALAGFFLGTLAIISESKVVTTAVVLSLPLLDLIWVVVRRVVIEKTSPAHADKKHIHHRLLQVGFTHRSAVYFLYAWTAIAGILAVLYQGKLQWIIFSLSAVAMVILGGYLVVKVRK